jgi:CheY-like chemotaxis protein
MANLKKILIVDDEPDIVTYLIALFKDNGYDTISAENGFEALNILKKEKPDLITLDLQMPKNTGTDFYRKIRHNKEYKSIPVIVISGIAGKHLAVPKPVAFFDKPFDKEKLLKKVNEVLTK